MVKKKVKERKRQVGISLFVTTTQYLGWSEANLLSSFMGRLGHLEVGSHSKSSFLVMGHLEAGSHSESPLLVMLIDWAFSGQGRL